MIASSKNSGFLVANSSAFSACANVIRGKPWIRLNWWRILSRFPIVYVAWIISSIPCFGCSTTSQFPRAFVLASYQAKLSPFGVDPCYSFLIDWLARLQANENRKLKQVTAALHPNRDTRQDRKSRSPVPYMGGGIGRTYGIDSSRAIVKTTKTRKKDSRSKTI